MSRIHKRHYDLQSLIENKKFTEEIDLFLIGNSTESRSERVPSLIKGNFKGETYSIDYDVQFEKYLITPFSTKHNFVQNNLRENGKDLISQFQKDLKRIGIENKTILIDITSLKHPVVFYLIKSIKEEFNIKKLFVSYTEPERYDAKDDDNFNIKFDLTEKFHPANTLPGFLRIPQHDKEKLLVAVLGFEGARFSKAFEEINPSIHNTHIIVGFPSFHPNWQYFVYSKNQSTLNQSNAHLFLQRTPANDPFGIYNILVKIKEDYKDNEITIAPIGTKPHSLGVSMFAVDYEDVQLYYDFPSQGSKKRSFGIGKSSIYNLTNYVKGN